MIIYMTDEQAEKLGKYLRDYRSRLEKQQDDRRISWEELAGPIDLSGSLLTKIADGKYPGVTWKTAIQLRIGFGIKVFEIMGLDLDAPPLFKLKDGEG